MILSKQPSHWFAYVNTPTAFLHDSKGEQWKLTYYTFKTLVVICCMRLMGPFMYSLGNSFIHQGQRLNRTMGSCKLHFILLLTSNCVPRSAGDKLCSHLVSVKFFLVIYTSRFWARDFFIGKSVAYKVAITRATSGWCKGNQVSESLSSKKPR